MKIKTSRTDEAATTRTKQNNKQFTMIAAAISAAAISFVVLVVVIAFTNTAGPSLPQSRDIFTLYDHYNMTVVVVFDEEPPIVQLIAPDGSLVDMENIRQRPGSNFVQYFLPDAMPGVWRMNYDPLTNSEITTPYSVYMSHIFISNFESAGVSAGMLAIEPLANAGLPVSFEVSADDAGEFTYELHAVFTSPDNSISEEVLLAQGYGMLNETLSFAAETAKIQDVGGFMLRLTVSVQHGQAAVRDTAWLDLRLIPISY